MAGKQQSKNMIVDEAVRWWRMKRPVHMRLTQHLENPTYGCTTADEHGLALAVARFVAIRREKSGDAVQEWERE